MFYTNTYNDIYKKAALIVLLLLFLFAVKYLLSEHSNETPKKAAHHIPSIDLEEIKARGKLVAITENSSTSYFIYKGEPMGYEYEMLRLFAKHLNVDLEIKVARDMDKIFNLITKGEANIIAANITVTKERATKVKFTKPLMITKQVLIQKKPDNWRRMSKSELEKHLLRNPVDLAGKEIHVRKESSFYSRLVNLSEEIGGKILIMEAPGNMDTEQLIGHVANGLIDYTIADENIALINQTYYPDIDIKTAVSLPQQISWAVGKDSDQLLIEINNWLQKRETKAKMAVIYNKYFKNSKEAIKRSESSYYSLTGGDISQYDPLIKKFSTKIGWDWRLVASLICQESRFNHSAESWMGASGLMQMMPSTYSYYYADSIYITPDLSIKAGTSYLLQREKYWKKYIFDDSERIKFVLASYNVGLGHVIDARRLAIKYDRNPNQWDDNVGYFLLQKSLPEYYKDPVVKHGYCRGREPVKFVKEILYRYEHYKNTYDENADNETITKNTRKS
ncbi:MAG: transporter substrate-binding domain-containing protein [Bacteroidota bacterium]|nr:transporter substrate-binding domain-containing protein [Bacteroidota bacterium]